MKLNPIIAAALALALAPSAFALTLKEKQTLNDWNKWVTEESYQKKVKETCGIDVPVKIDEKMVTPFMEDNANAANACASPLSVMSSMCEDATAKKEISSKIKKISCHLGKPGEVTGKLSGGDLSLTVGTGAANLDEKMKKFLENNL